jgi:hypothetical protein
LSVSALFFVGRSGPLDGKKAKGGKTEQKEKEKKQRKNVRKLFLP